MPRYDFVCENGHEQIDTWKGVNDPKPACPQCGEPTQTLWRSKGATVIGDEIPLGVTTSHIDGKPHTFHSKSELKRFAASHGLRLADDQHLPKMGTDKDPYRSKWF